MEWLGPTFNFWRSCHTVKDYFELPHEAIVFPVMGKSMVPKTRLGFRINLGVLQCNVPRAPLFRTMTSPRGEARGLECNRLPEPLLRAVAFGAIRVGRRVLAPRGCLLHTLGGR